jgi:hypothetical protein
VASVELEWIVQLIEPLAGSLIPAVDDPSIRL